MSRRKDPTYTVFIAAEGPSELGDLARERAWRQDPPRDGYFQPMMRRLLDENVAFDGQTITLLGRFEQKRKLNGHADRAAKALALASTVEGCRVLVFAHDVDKASSEKRNATERSRRLKDMHAEIEAGFAAVRGADHIARVKATPLRMIEAWALGDRAAIAKVAGKEGDTSAVHAHPEETWGDEKNPASGHPKCLLRRALSRNPNPQDFADLATEADLDTLRASCPASFAPFADEAETAANDAYVRHVVDDR
ncbi:MAG: DUF4276 family protein [Byssovorax sp.]